MIHTQYRSFALPMNLLLLIGLVFNNNEALLLAKNTITEKVSQFVISDSVLKSKTSSDKRIFYGDSILLRDSGRCCLKYLNKRYQVYTILIADL